MIHQQNRIQKKRPPKIHIGRYIDPLSDYGFKMLFGSEQSKDLRSFDGVAAIGEVAACLEAGQAYQGLTVRKIRQPEEKNARSPHAYRLFIQLANSRGK